MKIGDYVTVQQIADQSECRWVVLSDMVYDDEYCGAEGGIVKFIGNTKWEAGKVAADLELGGTPTLLVCGALETLSVGGVFVE